MILDAFRPTVLFMDTGDSGNLIHFDPYVSRIETGFWHELAQRKLEKYKLSEAEHEIKGCYSSSKLVKNTRITVFFMCSYCSYNSIPTLK